MRFCYCFQTLQREIEGHQPRVDEVLERGRRMAAASGAEDRPEERRITEQLQELEEAWTRLQDEISKRRERLNGSNLAQQYYNDADEAEAWIWEQELYMIADEKAKVRSRRCAVCDLLRKASTSVQRSHIHILTKVMSFNLCAGVNDKNIINQTSELLFCS